MKAKCMCPTHGRLQLDDVLVREGNPICGKCSKELQFAEVRPRKS